MVSLFTHPYTHLAISSPLDDTQQRALRPLDLSAGTYAPARGAPANPGEQGPLLPGLVAVTIGTTIINCSDIKDEVITFNDNFPHNDIVRGHLDSSALIHEVGRMDFVANVTFEARTGDLNTMGIFVTDVIADRRKPRLLLAVLNDFSLIALVVKGELTREDEELWRYSIPLRNWGRIPPRWKA